MHDRHFVVNHRIAPQKAMSCCGWEEGSDDHDYIDPPLVLADSDDTMLTIFLLFLLSQMTQR